MIGLNVFQEVLISLFSHNIEPNCGKNALSHLAMLENLPKILDLGLDAEVFQNLISSCFSTDSSLVKNFAKTR